MTKDDPRAIAAVMLAIVSMAACDPPPRTAPAPARPATAAPSGTALAESQRRYVEADVRFMQHMIAHHAQALEMTSLVRERTDRADIRLIAERIEVSQNDEIARMRSWLSARGESTAPAATGHAGHGAAAAHSTMPGMLTPEELSRLANARGAEFDRLFLELMIKHHEGALVMVAELFATDGAGQELDIFRFASDVDTDQRAEIRRMRAILGSLAPSSST